MLAAGSGNSALVNFLLEKGACVNSKDQVYMILYYMHELGDELCVLEGHILACPTCHWVTVLPLHLQDGSTALMFAVQKGHEDIAKLFISWPGSDVQAKDNVS